MHAEGEIFVENMQCSISLELGDDEFSKSGIKIHIGI